MPRFAANLSTLFTELPFMARFAAAKAAGFAAVECQFPYAHTAAELRSELNRHGLTLVLHNLPAGNWAAGERGVACHPNRVDEFRAGVAQTLAYATALGCPRVNCLAGLWPDRVSQADAHATLVANLRYAAAALSAARIQLLIEPINPWDVPGFFVTRTDQALALIDEVGSDNLLLQYDVYHAQRVEGELGNTLKNHLSQIGHIQIADNPGRHEPGTGEINYPWLFKHLNALGYRGHVGCEYTPLTRTEEGLGWMRDLRDDE